MDRVFLKDFDGRAVRDAATVRQLRRVLRLGNGDAFLGTDGRREWDLEVLDGEGEVRVRVRAQRDVVRSGPRVIVGQALLKKPRWELFIEKMTELGVAEIYPVVAERCVAKSEVFDTERQERWERIVQRAAAQCCGTPPKMHEPWDLEGWLASERDGARWVCSTDGASSPIVNALERNGDSDSVTLLVGPEGDFSAEEMERIRRAGFDEVSLGPRILRAETAAVAAATAVMLWAARGRDAD